MGRYSHQHGTTINRKHSDFDVHMTVRLRSTDLATVARWMLLEGSFIINRSKITQTAMDLAVQKIIELGGEHVPSTEKAIELLHQLEIGDFHPRSQSQFSLMRKLQEEQSGGQKINQAALEQEIERFKEEHGGANGRIKAIEDRDAETKEAYEMTREQAKKLGILAETENDEKN